MTGLEPTGWLTEDGFVPNPKYRPPPVVLDPTPPAVPHAAPAPAPQTAPAPAPQTAPATAPVSGVHVRPVPPSPSRAAQVAEARERLFGPLYGVKPPMTVADARRLIAHQVDGGRGPVPPPPPKTAA
ncbi:hypothetical protein, partial [uncultured Thiodictyon sp.]|uniref:hypothetical protein n=1 Tax=uncultured Thiodictyon sp. TaxID=1846217 RepID=UPI0025D148EB